jgi:ribosomal protein L11 methyltransferase
LPSDLGHQTSDIISIEIDAHLAFGTGTHETTRMLCATLLDMDLQGKRVLDCGCGTGILGICALKLGADSCVGYDIDEWSADNTRHNAVINHVDDRLTSLCGDSSVLSGFAAEFDIVLANINRNILLADMPRFVSVMAPHSTLILSGFYESDCTLLESKAQQLGLKLIATKTDGDWACMVFQY